MHIYTSILFSWCHAVICFNVDYEYTVLKVGPKGSLFGYSVSEHQEGANHWLLVGAPRGNCTFLNGADKEFSGTVYKCDASNQSPSCPDEIPFDDTPSISLASRANQWLGVSLKSAGKDKSIASCAHRYEFFGKIGGFNLLEGKCWVVSSTFKGEGEYKPCRRYNEGGVSQSFENFGQCEAGISMDILPPDKENYTSFLFGAPGSKSFSGRVFDVNDDDAQFESNLPDGDFKYSYFGYSIVHGHFISKKEFTIAVGGPRYSSYGKVFIYQDKLKSIVQDIPISNDEIQLASGFGTSLCAIDSNADGFDELVVGAPFHSNAYDRPNQGLIYIYKKDNEKDVLVFLKTMDISKWGTNAGSGSYFGNAVENAGDINLDGYQDLIVGAPHDNDGLGAVYLYQGSNVGLTDAPSQVIKASTIQSGLNNNLGLKGFGKSFGVGFDLDTNGYNDILIGAYASDQVVLLRSRPVISTKLSLSFTPKELNLSKGCKVRGVNTTCFDMSFCFNFSEPSRKIYKNPGDFVPIKYIIRADPIKRPRVRFASGLVTEELVENTAKSVRCVELKKLYLVYNYDGSIAIYPDIVFEVSYALPYGTKGLSKPIRTDAQVVNLDKYPALAESFDGGKIVKQIHKLNYQLTFQRECVACIPDLSINAKKNYTFGLGQSTYKLNITLKNSGVDPAYSVGLIFDLTNDIKLEKVIGADKNEIICPNGFCEDIFNKFSKDEEVVINVVLDTRTFTPESENKFNVTIKSANQENASTIFDNKVTIQLDLKVEADIELLGKSTQQVLYTGEVKGESAMKSLEDIGGLVEHRYIVRNIGPDRLPSARLTINWPYETLSGKHLLYLVDVTKTSSVTDCKLQQKNNNLDLKGSATTSPTSAKSQVRFSSDSSSNQSPRKRRDIDDELLPATHAPTQPVAVDNIGEITTSSPDITEQKKRKKDGVVLNCVSAHCTPIVCTFKNVGSRTTEAVTIRSRLWQPSLSIDYYGKVLTIVSEGEVDTGTNLTYIYDPNVRNNVFELYTTVNPVFPATEKKEKLWIYIIAVVAGVLLLALLILGLYKLGFFKRKRYGNRYGVVKEDKANKPLMN